MLSAENLASIESEGRRLAAAARVDPQREVPQYPGWTLSDLASHTASIHGRTTLICRELPEERISAPRLPEGKDPVDWYEETLEDMLGALREMDPETRVWGFVPEPTLGFWENRMVIETGVHRWDAEQGTERDEKLTDLVARRGLDEFGVMWLPMLGEVTTLECVASDFDESWIYGEADPVNTVEGTASDLYLRLVSRRSPVELPQDWAEAVDALKPPPKR